MTAILLIVAAAPVALVLAFVFIEARFRRREKAAAVRRAESRRMKLPPFLD